jgi:acyl-CoA synthetase (AMP-forming)/AMP-acid ligase II
MERSEKHYKKSETSSFLYFRKVGSSFRVNLIIIVLDDISYEGENVSTAEVEEVVTRGAGMKGCVVYGVQVPGNEGRCGMAAISDPEGNLNLIQLASEVNLRLPSYARPLFVRVINQEMNMTGMVTPST